MNDDRRPPIRGTRTDRRTDPSWSTGAARLELTLTPAGDRCTVTMVGSLDALSTPAVDTQYDQLLGAGFDEVVLDVTGIRQVDESGAVALAQLWARLRNCGVFCRIRGMAPKFAENPVELLLHIRGSGTPLTPGWSSPTHCPA